MNELCRRLGCRWPIVQSGMGGVAGADLVAEVCEAGAFGILAGLNLPPSTLRARIGEVRSLTGRPFGVNVWLHTDLQPPRDPASLGEATVAGANGQLNALRAELGLDLVPGGARPAPAPDLVGAAIDVVLEERPAVLSVGLGDPGADLVARCHDAGILVMAMVTTVADASALAAEGVDIIVAQGGEAGGHRSTWVKRPPAETMVATMALVPQVVDCVGDDHLVLAAGGIADGRGLIAALALGAHGVLLGSRFVATAASGAAPFWKDALVRSDGTDTVVTDAFTGYYARTVRNRFNERYDGPVLPSLLQAKAAADIYGAANPEYFPMHAGQSAGLITDIPTAADVVRRIVTEAGDAFARLSWPPHD